MKFYFVAANDVNGENWDLFVMAESPRNAADIMLENFEMGSGHFDQPVRVYEVPSPRPGPWIFDWGDIPVTIIDLNQQEAA